MPVFFARVLTMELPDEAARVAAEKARRAHMSLAEWIGVRIAGRRGTRGAGVRDAVGSFHGNYRCGGRGQAL